MEAEVKVKMRKRKTTLSYKVIKSCLMLKFINGVIHLKKQEESQRFIRGQQNFWQWF